MRILGLLLLTYLSVAALSAIESLSANGHDRRIDLQWLPFATGTERFTIERANNKEGPFTPIATGHRSHIYSDFIGENERTYFYRVTCTAGAGNSATPSEIVSASSREMNDDQLLDSVQLATFRFFWDYAHPVSGLIRNRTDYTDSCGSGATGFGLFALIVGAERGFVSRPEVAARVAKILGFLDDKTERFHGAFPHLIHGVTGKTITFGPLDDGADLVETALLIQGVLTVRQYFNQNDPVETEIRRRATRLWEAVQWDWFLREPAGKVLYWHWSPKAAWQMNVLISGYNECMITYLLAIASPTHPIPADCYDKGWARNRNYSLKKSYYGLTQYAGHLPMGGPLFLTQYSFLGFDPRNKRDRYCNYFENARNTSLIHRAYAIENPGKHKGYGENCWGITASAGPDYYFAWEPGKNDNGTIAPTAALSAMPFTPQESMACLKHLYQTYGKRLWGEFGFKDAFNLNRDWFADRWLAIDQGPIIAMIENARTGLCWSMFMKNPEIPHMLNAIGWQHDPLPSVKQ